MSRSRTLLAGALAVAVAVALAAGASLAWRAGRTEAAIDGHRSAVRDAALRAPPPARSAAAYDALPEPVRRWVAFTFPSGPVTVAWADVEMTGRFRRPRTDGFASTTARQVAAVDVPALAFDATTPVAGVLWARAFDAYVDGRMTMRASLLSALTVVDVPSSPELDRVSLRRWLIESPFYPAALLPGGPVRWEPVDGRRARARARLGGVEATLVASFDDDGRLSRLDAEDDGDLDAPYHGSGEQVVRDDYRLVDGMMVPHRFEYARVGAGRVSPFWEGRVTAVRFGVRGGGR